MRQRLGLDWTLVITEPLEPEIAIVTGETSNRSIVEEISVQVRLLKILDRAGWPIVLTGTGADEVFVGYTHLFGRVRVTEMQQRFVSSHYRFDLPVSTRRRWALASSRAIHSFTAMSSTLPGTCMQTF